MSTPSEDTPSTDLSGDFQDVAAMTFEEAMAELEDIVRGLEQGTASLEASIDGYARGAALKRHCEAKLKEAQLRIDKIVVGSDGAAGAEPADLD